MFELAIGYRDDPPRWRLAFVERTLALVLGRDPASDLVLPSRLASRRHAQLVEADGTCMLIELGSDSGTYVNHERLRMQHVLRTGDVFDIGDLRLRFARVVLAGAAPYVAADDTEAGLLATIAAGRGDAARARHVRAVHQLATLPRLDFDARCRLAAIATGVDPAWRHALWAALTAR